MFFLDLLMPLLGVVVTGARAHTTPCAWNEGLKRSNRESSKTVFQPGVVALERATSGNLCES